MCPHNSPFCEPPALCLSCLKESLARDTERARKAVGAGPGRQAPEKPAPPLLESTPAKAAQDAPGVPLFARIRSIGREIGGIDDLRSPAAGVTLGVFIIAVEIGMLSAGPQTTGGTALGLGVAVLGAACVGVGVTELLRERRRRQREIRVDRVLRCETLVLDFAEAFLEPAETIRQKVASDIVRLARAGCAYVVIDCSALPRVPPPVAGAVEEAYEKLTSAERPVLLFAGVGAANREVLARTPLGRTAHLCESMDEARAKVQSFEAERARRANNAPSAGAAPFPPSKGASR